MSCSTEYQRHVRRRLEPLRIAARAVGSSTPPPGNGGPPPGGRGSVVVVESCGIQYQGVMLHDAGMDWSCGGQKPYLANRFVEECIRLSQLRHPNLAMFYGVTFDSASLTLVMDHPSETLDECLLRYQGIPEFTKVSILLDAARGLLYLHSQQPPIAHANLSTKSVLLFSSTRAKIGNVGVAGSLGAYAEPARGRWPPAPFVHVLEKGARYSDPHIDIPAFGNVVVHTVQQQRWLAPPGNTSPSPHLQNMSSHPLFSLASQCLQSSTHAQQVPRADVNYVVQYLEQASLANPPPFHNPLELYQSLMKVEENAKKLQEKLNARNKTPSPDPVLHERLRYLEQEIAGREKELAASREMIFAKESVIQSLTAQLELAYVKNKDINSHSFPPNNTIILDTSPKRLSPASLNRYSPSSLPEAISSTAGKQDVASPTSNLSSPLNTSGASMEPVSPTHTSTGQTKAQPPKPPQRKSSFRKKGVQIEPAFTGPSQQKSPAVKPVCPHSGGQTMPNSLLLPSKYTPSTPKENAVSVQQSAWSQQSLQNSGPISTSSATSSPKSAPFDSGNSEFQRLLNPSPKSAPFDSSNSEFQRLLNPSPKSAPFDSSNSEFQRLLNRQREKISVAKTNSLPLNSSSPWGHQQPPTACVNGTEIGTQESTSSESLQGLSTTTTEGGMKRSSTPPKPPRRTSSIKSHQKPKKYASSNGSSSPPAAPCPGPSSPHLQSPSVCGGQRRASSPSPPTTPPSTGQLRESSAETELQRLLAQQKVKVATNTPGMGFQQLEMQRLEKQKRMVDS